MTLLALLGRDEDATDLVRDFEHERVPGSDGAAWLAWKAPAACAAVDADLAVVSEGQAGSVVIAEKYRRHGLQCVREIVGPFAFILYDKRERRLFASSDLTSRATLAYWFDREALVVSSRALRILAHPRVSRALDDVYLAHLLTGLWSAPSGTTALQAIRRLPAGVALVACDGHVDLVALDRLKPRGPSTRAKNAWVDAFWAELGLAVQRSTCDQPTCLSLSGGLDSAALASVVARSRVANTPMAAFSMVAPKRGADELEAIGELERAYAGHIVNKRIDCSHATSLSDLDRFELQDDPLMTPLVYLPGRFRLWSTACQSGFRTVLDGEGGDELFGLLVGPRDALLQGQWLTALRYLRMQRARRAIFTRAFLVPVLPGSLRRAWAQRRASAGQRLPSFLSQRALGDPAIEQATYQFYEGQIDEHREDAIHHWLSNPAVVGAWNTHRHIAAEQGLRLASPLLDRGVVELVLGIPAEWMLSPVYKRFLRDASAGRVPDRIRRRPKDVTLPVAHLREIAGSEEARALLGNARVRDRLENWIRFERVNGMLDGIAKAQGAIDSIVWQQIEGLIGFAYWYARASREHGVK